MIYRVPKIRDDVNHRPRRCRRQAVCECHPEAPNVVKGRRIYAMKNYRAATLIEMLVSLLLLGIAIGAIFGAFVIASTSGARARHRLAAINIARQKIELIKGTDYSQILTQAGTGGVIIDDASSAAGDELLGQCITTISDVYGDSKMYKVITTVQWTEHKAPNPIEEKVMTLISQH